MLLNLTTATTVIVMVLHDLQQLISFNVVCPNLYGSEDVDNIEYMVRLSQSLVSLLNDLTVPEALIFVEDQRAESLVEKCIAGFKMQIQPEIVWQFTDDDDLRVIKFNLTPDQIRRMQDLPYRNYHKVGNSISALVIEVINQLSSMVDEEIIFPKLH